MARRPERSRTFRIADLQWALWLFGRSKGIWCDPLAIVRQRTEKAGEKIQKEADRSHTTDDSTRS